MRNTQVEWYKQSSVITLISHSYQPISLEDQKKLWFWYYGVLKRPHLSFFFPTVLPVSHSRTWWMCWISPGVLNSHCLGGDKTNTKSDENTLHVFCLHSKKSRLCWLISRWGWYVRTIHARIADLFNMSVCVVNVFIWFAKNTKNPFLWDVLFLYIQLPQNVFRHLDHARQQNIKPSGIYLLIRLTSCCEEGECFSRWKGYSSPAHSSRNRRINGHEIHFSHGWMCVY